MTDQQLMQAIKEQLGSVLATRAVPPPAFLAALIANETGEQFAAGGLAAANHAKRFESGVLVSLWKVLLGRATSYGVFKAPDLLQFVAGLTAPPISVPQSISPNAFHNLDDLATSWGLTQIMGYHCLEPYANARTPQSYQIPATSVLETARLLGEFSREFHLDLTADFSQMFRCWNTGKPNGQTADPNYVANGLARMKFYESLAINDTDPGIST